jgi:hypothetical protein
VGLILAFLAIAFVGSIRDIVRPYKIRDVYEARAVVNSWLTEISPEDQIECLVQPEDWDVCMNWLFLPIRHRVSGPGWGQDTPVTFGKLWIITDHSQMNIPELIQLRWPGAEILSHRFDDFSLIPPNPHRQRFERFEIQINPESK